MISEKETIGKLSDYIQNELTSSSNLKILKQFPFFYDNFSQETLNKMCDSMEEVLYAPKQTICNTKSGYDDSIFLILKGEGKHTHTHHSCFNLTYHSYFHKQVSFYTTEREEGVHGHSNGIGASVNKLEEKE